MAHVILFHSVMGLRDLERDAAERFRAAGHEVVTPDLYDGQTAAVLAGISMGAGLACQVWAKRAQTSGVLLLNGLGDIPKWVRSGLPVQVHFAEPDQYISDEQATSWPMTAFRVGLCAEIYTYDGVGHLYTDAASPDYDAAAAAQTWERSVSFLEGL